MPDNLRPGALPRAWEGASRPVAMNPLSTDRCWMGWAVYRPGHRLYVQFGGDEDEAWTVALGWPSEDEIEYAKVNGARAFPVRIMEEPTDAG